MVTQKPRPDTLQYFAPTESFPDDLSHVKLSGAERSVLNRFNAKVGASRDLDELMLFIFEATRETSITDRVGLAFLEEDERHLVMYRALTTYEPVLMDKGYSEDIGEGSLLTVIEKGRPRIIHDLQEYARHHPNSRSTEMLLREGVRSSMTCPLSVDGRNAGVMFISSRQPHAFDEHHARIHELTCERLSQAAEKTYRIERLTAAKREYEEMLGFVSHELRSPVVSMLSVAELLLDGLVGTLQPEQYREIERIAGKGKYLLNLIGAYLDLAMLEKGEITLQVESNVDFASDVLAPAIELVGEPWQAKGMKLESCPPEEPGPIECDPGLLKVVMINLLSNAAKYGRQQGRIRVRWHRTRQAFVAAVFNEGPGFPESEKPRLFRKFSRLRTPELIKQKGSGLGLHNVWRILQLHGGRVVADSRPGQWAQFTVEIPQPLHAAVSPGAAESVGLPHLSATSLHGTA
ncbi:MAG: GAF domain-containing sensor histidine kinase [Pirellulales bacterium]|nr:GAF domain-containing sensor histidine kinase [Pirellulales bacterium]